MSSPHSKRSGSRFFVDLSPLKESRAFAKLWIGNSIATIGAQMTIVAVGMHIYDITRSTFAVSLVALWALGPMIIAGLWGGMLADVFDRRSLSILTALVSWVSIILLAAITFMGVTVTWPLYLLAAINAASVTILGATRAAIMPRLLPPNLIPAASALYGITFGVAVSVGPALAGVFAATVGFGWTYLVDALLFTAGFLGILSLPKIAPEGNAAKPGLQSLKDGWAFLKQSPNIRATFVYDLIAMTFGQTRVVFPAVGMLALGGGYVTAGALTTAVAVGTFLSSVASGWLGRVRYQGRAVTIAIACYGVSIALFGLVVLIAMLTGGGSETEPRTWLLIFAFVALAMSGASDNVSAVFRSTILQVAAPDEMRGRMQGIFTIVVTGGPRLGDMYAGALVAIIAMWAPALVGGLMIVALMVIFAKTYRGFMAYDAANPQA